MLNKLESIGKLDAETLDAANEELDRIFYNAKISSIAVYIFLIVSTSVLVHKIGVPTTEILGLSVFLFIVGIYVTLAVNKLFIYPTVARKKGLNTKHSYVTDGENLERIVGILNNNPELAPFNQQVLSKKRNYTHQELEFIEDYNENNASYRKLLNLGSSEG